MLRAVVLSTLAWPMIGAAAELRIEPDPILLTGPAASQQLIVVESSGGRATQDKTATAQFTSSHSSIATVDRQGLVRAVANGTATITASVEGQQVTATVRVTQTEKTIDWSFRNQIEPILTRTGCNSGACHGALAGKGGFKLSLRGYDPDVDYYTITRQALARRVDTAHPEDSLLLKKAVRAIPHGGGTRFDTESAYYETLRDWLAAGAPGPHPQEPHLSELRIAPKTALLPLKGTMRFVVQAAYSDGTVRDVTDLVKFVSSHDPAVTVDEDGQAIAMGHGEAGIAALFGSQVTVATVTVPYPNTPDAALFSQMPIHNFVDSLILNKLRMLQLPPATTCTDAEFIRRAFLDTCGILPTPSEVEAFRNDPDPAKRNKLIDQLLSRPEYVDYWTHKWSDLLLVSTRKLSTPAMWAMYRAIRQAVADNHPWDRFARDILTASGGTQMNGGGGYFIIHKDITELAETTAATFLGTAIGCAKCHNHPLEKWTQDQYWAFANLFARVGLKENDNTNRSKKNRDIIVVSLPTGDALHPRTGQPMPPAPLDGPVVPDGVDRRKHLADWITRPDNPLFAKAIVNRVWRNYMGRGLVEAEDDFRDTNPPSNAELLEALTQDFIAHGYDLKHVMRVILRSAAYQRSSQPAPGTEADDRFYSRYFTRRLPAEVVLDAYSQVLGVPTPFNVISLGPTGGERNTTDYPLGTRAVQLPDSLVVSRFLDSFGRAERQASCSCELSLEPTVGQALHLYNGQTLNEKLKDPKSRLTDWLARNLTDEELVQQLFQLTLARSPTAAERAEFVETLTEASQEGPTARREALEDLFWAVLTGNEFLFNH